MGIFGPPNIEKMKAKKNVKGLIKALSYQEDWEVRKNAAKGLGEIGDPPAVEPLIAKLKDNDINVRKAVVEALSKIGKPAVKPLLIAALNDESPQAATEVLTTIGKPAVEPLIATLKDKDNYYAVREAAADALGRIGDARAVMPLIAALRVKDWDVCRAAARALGAIGEPAVKPLIAASKGEASYVVRGAAAGALGIIGDPRAEEPLIATLRGKDWDVDKKYYVVGVPEKVKQYFNYDVPQDAADALIRLGWKPDHGRAGAWYCITKREWKKASALGSVAVEPLIAALKDEVYEVVRKDVAEALGAIGDPRAVEPLIVALKDKRDWEVRKAAAGALGMTGDVRAVEPLIVMLRDWARDVSKAAAEALDRLGWKPDAGENGAWYWIAKREWEKASALGSLVVEPLIAFLKQKEWEDMEKAAVALGMTGDVRAVEPLIATLKDDEYWVVRKAAVDALDRLGWKPDAGENGVYYWVAKREFEKAATLGSVAVEPLIAIIKTDHNNWDERKAAARTLAKMYQEETLDEPSKRSILAARKTIVRRHNDGVGKCGHEDTGIGVKFPL